MAYDVTCEVTEHAGVIGLLIPGEIVTGLRLDELDAKVGFERTRFDDYVLYNEKWAEMVVEIKEQRRGNE